MARKPETKAQATRRKENEVLSLRLKGEDFDTIAAKVGYANKSSACKAYHRALTRTTVDTEAPSTLQQRENDRTLDLARLDALHKAIWPQASRGNLSAVDRILKIEERRDKLLGLSRTAALDTGASIPGQSGGNVVPMSRMEEMRARLAAQRTGSAGG